MRFARSVATFDPVDVGDHVCWLVGPEEDFANREGFRALRVLAQMEHLWPDGVGARLVADYELSLDSVVAGGRAFVVCAYRRDRFASHVKEQATGVHPQHLGTRRLVALSFRMFSQGPDCWSVSGVVDAEGAEAFGIAVGELVARSATVQLLCEELELMDAAGMRALRAAATRLPGRRVVLQGVNATVRRMWILLGFDVSAASVEMLVETAP